MKILKFIDFINESFLGVNKISFSNEKSWNNLSNIITRRIYLPIVNIDGDVIYLEKDGETIEITKDGEILSHMRNGHKMIQTYNVDNITKKELSKIK